MQLHRLDILHRQVRLLLLIPVSDLHEESGEQRPAYVLVELRFGSRIREVGYERYLVPFHDSLELRADVVGLDEVALREVMAPRPLAIPNIYEKRGWEIKV